MGKKNQLYGKYVRILQSADDRNEVLIVIRKDQPMDKKYIRQFDNTYTNTDIILTITPLKRKKNGNSTKEEKDTKEEKGVHSNPFWSIDNEL